MGGYYLREIKFDWLRKIKGVWHHRTFTMPFIPEEIELEEINEIVQTKRGIFRQFTNRHDKDGNEIYEGDTLEYKENELKINERHTVKFFQSGYSCAGQNLDDLELDLYWTIIGNIFEDSLEAK